jgi:tryptophan halogenase
LPASWLAVYFGQGLMPNNYDSRVEQAPIESLARHFSGFHQQLVQAANLMPSHTSSIVQTKRMEPGLYPAAPQSLYGINA